MKTTRASLVGLALAGMWGSLFAQEAPEPVAGQTEKQVIAALGKPHGRIGSAAKAYLYYPRGKIILQNGVVTEVEFLSPEQQVARDARKAELDAQLQAERDKANALLAGYLQDPQYLALTTRDRMLALERFQRLHPAAQVTAEYQALRAIYNEEISNKESVTRLQNEVVEAKAQAAAAQSQAAAAQQQAATAQQQAAQAQKSAQVSYQNVGYYTPVVNYPYSPLVTVVTFNNGQPVVVTTNPQPYYCAPVIPPAPKSGFSIVTNGSNLQVSGGWAVANARANFWYNPARRLN